MLAFSAATPPVRRRPKIAEFGICDFTGIGSLADSQCEASVYIVRMIDKIIPARPV